MKQETKQEQVERERLTEEEIIRLAQSYQWHDSDSTQFEIHEDFGNDVLVTPSCHRGKMISVLLKGIWRDAFELRYDPKRKGFANPAEAAIAFRKTAEEYGRASIGEPSLRKASITVLYSNKDKGIYNYELGCARYDLFRPPISEHAVEISEIVLEEWIKYHDRMSFGYLEQERQRKKDALERQKSRETLIAEALEEIRGKRK